MTTRKTQQAPILVTGVAGFIGFHTATRLLERGERVIGLDNVNDYYDVRLKKARLAKLKPFKSFSFTKLDLASRVGMKKLFAKQPIRRVVHLAAQAGVRYSLVNPHAYTDSNIDGFLNILEGCRQAKVEHLVYASSSSVYGGNTRMPFSIHDNVDHPVSLYAASKKANELMAHCYAHLYRIPCTGLRFFTVYGPWGRPDMALFIFTKAILDDLRPVFASVCADFESELVEFDGEDDHVHLLVNYPPKVAISKLVNSLKGISSLLIRKKNYPSIQKKLWGGALWSPSYFAGSCGGAPLAVIRQYIEQQQAPH